MQYGRILHKCGDVFLARASPQCVWEKFGLETRLVLLGLCSLIICVACMFNINHCTNTHTHTHTHTLDRSALPKRNKPVYGMALLWQPDVVYPYLALIEHYNGCAETMEAAAGAIQNLTACNWKVHNHRSLVPRPHFVLELKLIGLCSP